MTYFDTFRNAYESYAGYLFREITFQSEPWYHNYFLWLVLISAFFFGLEWLTPWRKDQPRFRKDFWLDFFYMFFNFFLFSLIIYNAASDVFVQLFKDLLGTLGIRNLLAFEVASWPLWGHLLLGFMVRDFVQWWIHRLLNASPFLWEYHKVHHSVEQMGFAAHLRYHWMENIVYRSIEYLPLALLGIGLYDFFIIHIFTLAVGHYNHSNISVDGRITGGVFGTLIGLVLMSTYGAAIDYAIIFPVVSALIGAFVLGPYMKYIFNSPEMHIWHHSYNLPADRQTGINFGLSLSVWDWIFGTAYIPHDGRDIRLGFPGVEEFPEGFVGQELHGVAGKNS